MKKLTAILIVLFAAGFIFAAAAQADVVDTVITVIKTRGQTSTPTPTASTAVRG